MTITFEATFKRAFQISDNPFQNLNQNKIQQNKYRQNEKGRSEIPILSRL